MIMHNPPHPGELIHDVYLEPFNLSSRAVAKNLGVSPSTFNRIVKGQSSISPEMALKLQVVLGGTPESWLAMQHQYDLWKAKQTINLKAVKSIDFDQLALA